MQSKILKNKQFRVNQAASLCCTKYKLSPTGSPDKGTENKKSGLLETVILGIFMDKLLRIIRVVLYWYLNYIFCLCIFRDLAAGGS